MYLKRLQLQGFKTFANKTELAFAPGITAVVGPNGSGKSNVADALRWVLGEQSYLSLRGRKTEDVIFSGSSKRAPTGFAEVSLTLDNTGGLLPIDYSEVTITRRAHRSGENEYYINKSRVRLRDLQDLTAGLNHLYTVVGQGLVDTALSQRPEERRALFEAAAGISQFYSQKNEAEKRLRATEENMVRLHDLLSDSEPRLKLLERQAKHARDAQAVAADLHSRLRLWYSHLLTLAAAHEQATEAERTAATASVAATQANLLVGQAAERAARAQVTGATTALEQAAVQQGQLRDAAQQLERVAAVTAANVAALARQLAEQQRAGKEDEAATAARAATVVSLEQELAVAHAGLALLRADLIAAETRSAGGLLAERELAAQVEQAQGAHTFAASALAASQRAAEEAARSVQRARSDALAASNALTPLEMRLQQGKAAAQVASATAQVENERLAAAQAECSRLAQAVAEMSSRQRAAEAASLPLRAAEQQIAARLDALQRLHESGAGLFDGVRAVLDVAGQGGRPPKLRGIIGTVASLLQVPADLELAIETALGGRLQDVVVVDWAAAEAAISLLKRTNAGRATFLPLDTIRYSRVPAPSLAATSFSTSTASGVGAGATGILGIAADLVGYNPLYTPVAVNLLGRTLVVEELAVARRLVREEGGWTVVTREGEIVRPSGSVTGGSSGKGKDSGLLARERELRDLPATLAVAHRRWQTAQTAAASIEQDWRRVSQQLEQANRQLAEATRLATTAAAATATTSRELERAKQELDYRKAAAAEFGKRAEIVAASVENRATEIAAHLLAVTAAATTLAAANDELNRLRGSRTEAVVALATLRATIGGNEEALHRQQATLQAAERDLASLRRAVAERQTRLTLLLAEVDRLRVAQAATASDLQSSNDELAAAEAATLPLRQQLATAQEEAVAASDAISRQQHALLAAEQSLGRASLACDRATHELEDIHTRAVAELGDDSSPQPPAVAKLDRLEDEIASLRNRLARLGLVNPLAVAEYTEAAARHEFMASQTEDLQAAAASLQVVIAELETTMQQRFSITFAAVALQFSLYFTRLFGGGAARLEMSSAAGGVEIAAQPPGKRWQNLPSLSGGERALTAVALLFSLLSVNPSPFCLLDEVDAALDEANIGRITTALTELSAKTQFIVITHNRSTIAAAGAVYGIALGDDHTSRAFSASLAEVA